jgi:hypothetical protein
MRRAFDMYQHIDHDSMQAAHDESGLRRVRRDRRGLTMDEVVRGGWHGSQPDVAHALVASYDEERAPQQHRNYYPTLPAATTISFVDDETVAVCEDPVQRRVFVSEDPAAHDPRGWGAPPSPVYPRRGVRSWRTLRANGVSTERIAVEALATLAGVLFLTFVCAFVFHLGLSTLFEVQRPKTPKLPVSTSVAR